MPSMCKAPSGIRTLTGDSLGGVWLGTDEGVYLYDGKFCDMIMAKDLPIIDETAEHEAFLGALGVEYLRSKNIFGAIEFALVASAITASKVGAISSIPDEAEIRAVARKLREEQSF